ncbi:MAK10-like protein [Tanacetum coccineum]
MGDENPIRSLGDYSKPIHEGYMNTIELPVGNNVVPLRSDTIRLVQNGCSFHGLRSEDPNQHLKDFLKLVDSLDLDGENRERTRLRLFQFSLRDQASNWLERLPAGSITTWEDLTTRFLAQFFPPGRTAKLRNDILMFQQHHEESLASTFGSNRKNLWAILEDLDIYDNEVGSTKGCFVAKPVKAIALPQDVPSTSDRRLIELENQVQRLMEAHLAPTQPTQVNKITTSCEICSGPHDTQYCMEDPEQAFVEYASSRTDEAGGKWYTFKPEQNNLGDTYNPSWKSHPNLRWRQPQNSQNNFSNPPNRFQPNGSIPNRSFNNRPQNFNNQSNIEGLVSEFMASQDARLSKFEADFKQQQSEMTNKIDTVLKAITDRIAGTLPSDTVKNPKLSATPVLSARSYPTIDPQCSSHPSNSINAIKAHFKEATISQTSLQQPEIETEPPQPEEPEPTLEDEFQDLHLNLPVLEVLAHAPIYNAILDKYVESLELGKNGSAFVQGEIPAKMEDPRLFTLPCRLGDSKPFDTLADLGSCVNIIPLYLFKKLNIRLLEETDHIFGLADGTKSYPVRIVKDVEVHIGKLKLLNDFYVIDMKKDPETPLLVGRGFLATANAVIDCRMAKIAVGEGITRDAKLNPFKDTLVFRRMVEFIGAIPINLKCNMWESKDLVENKIDWNKPPKNGDGAWHVKIRIIDPDGEEFTKTLQSIPTTRRLSERENPKEIINLDHFYDT